MEETSKGFRDEFAFCSNFHPARVRYEGITYPTVEHAYQAAKTLNLALRREIARLSTPGQAKNIGRVIPNIRPDWEQVKLSIMESLVRQKFKHTELRDKLLNTKSIKLVEYNWWGDTFWGVCESKGENHLGKILMKVRKEL